MKKRLIASLLALILLISVLPITASAVSGLANFLKVNTYVRGQFTDVAANDWYEENVIAAYELNLMKGSGKSFNANGNISIAEAIALACRIHSIYDADGAKFTQGNPWYQIYVDYALQNGIISYTYSDYMKPVTRSEMAVILGNAIPRSEFGDINNIDNGAIPDISMAAPYADVVYMFYRAGVLTGDASGRFTPADQIGRHSVAAIASRIVDPALRKTMTLTPTGTGSLTPDEIYAKCASAVFLVSTYDVEGNPNGTGSGFFINADGTAVTNYHVIKNAFGTVISMTDGNTFSDVKVLAFSVEHDIAILKINGTGFPILTLGDSSKIKGGEKVYAIGNPCGLTSSITDGLISNVRREDYDNRIQISVPISPGNSGGALINEKGEVIGIPTSYLASGQNLNFAIPINAAMALPRRTPLSLGEAARLAAIEEYKNIPTAFEYNFNEVEPNDTWEQAPFIDNGMSLWGTIDDDLLDVYLLRCNAPGTINVSLYSLSSNTFIDDILMFVESSDGGYSPEARIEQDADGLHALFLSYTISKPGYYAITLLSKALYEYYYLNTDYTFYYEFIPS